jgi:AmmeMemoRadiSam system protein A
VTHGSVIFGLDELERERLLLIARESIACAVGAEAPRPLADLPPKLEQVCGAFVTLELHGRLRGCIGRIRATEPLARTIQDMARAAALNDPRFDPVKVAELPNLTIEISVLSPFEEIAVSDVHRIRIGTHGLYISQHGRAGLLLPQVAPEWGWNSEQFLEHTCEKAGLPTNAWRTGAKIELFSAEIFGDAST